MDAETIVSLVNGKKESRKGLDFVQAAKMADGLVAEAIVMLEKAHALSCLEAALHCDAYHEAKRSLDKYGYINTYVRVERRSLVTRFQYRFPSIRGFIRENIRKGRDGYTRSSFGRAANEEERDLALYTETHYARIRRRARKIRQAAQSLIGKPQRELVDEDDDLDEEIDE